MRKNKKIYIYNNETGELVKICKNRESAALFAKTTSSSVSRSLRGETKYCHCGYSFRYEDQDFESIKNLEKKPYNALNVCKKDKDGNILKIYKSQKSAAIDNNLNQSYISYQMTGRISKEEVLRKLGYYFDKYNGEEIKQEESETTILKPKQQEYLINILVGLVNGTLVDGAIYNINNMKFIYDKNEQMLVNKDVKIKRESYVVLCDIELPLLTTEEKDFLTTLKNNISDIETIIKCKNYNGMEYIRLQGKNIDLTLDEFKEATRYKGLKINQVYALKDLNIS